MKCLIFSYVFRDMDTDNPSRLKTVHCDSQHTMMAPICTAREQYVFLAVFPWTLSLNHVAML